MNSCRSEKELKRGGYKAPLERKVELGPRFFLKVNNEARKRGVSVREALEGMLAGWLESEAERQIKERTVAEERAYKELVERNERTTQQLAQIEKEDRLRELMGKQSWAYEQGRNSILLERNRYQREWRRKRKEMRSNGNSGLQ